MAERRLPNWRVHEDLVHFEWMHECISTIGNRYVSTVTMPHNGGTWRIEQIEPLTVSPSINCLACGTHGWIRDGKWVPA